MLATRLLPPLTVVLAAAAALPRLGWPAHATLGLLLPLAVCWAAPPAPQALAYAHRFRLNEGLAASIVRAGSAVSIGFMAAIALLSKIPVISDPVYIYTFLACLYVSLVLAQYAIPLIAAHQQQQQQQQQRRQPANQPPVPQGKVKMVYAGSPAVPAPAAVPGEGGSLTDEQQAATPPGSAPQQGSPPADQGGQQQQQRSRRAAFTDVDGGAQQQQPPGASAAARGRACSRYGPRRRLPAAPLRPALRTPARQTVVLLRGP